MKSLVTEGILELLEKMFFSGRAPRPVSSSVLFPFFFESLLSSWAASEASASHVPGGALHADQGATYKPDNRTPRGTHPEANAVAQAVGQGGENDLTAGPGLFPS